MAQRKKGCNADLLLNFTSYRETEKGRYKPPPRHVTRPKGYARTARRLERGRYVQTFRCHVLDTTPYEDVASCILEVDALIPWNRIQRVDLLVENPHTCPLCLDDEIVVPMITKCGHVFCMTCMIRCLTRDESTGLASPCREPRKCPICKEMVVVQDLRTVRFQWTGETSLLALCRKMPDAKGLTFFSGAPPLPTNRRLPEVPREGDDGWYFSRLVACSAAQLANQRHQEISALLESKQESKNDLFGDPEMLPFIDIAMGLLAGDEHNIHDGTYTPAPLDPYFRVPLPKALVTDGCNHKSPQMAASSFPTGINANEWEQGAGGSGDWWQGGEWGNDWWSGDWDQWQQAQASGSVFPKGNEQHGNATGSSCLPPDAAYRVRENDAAASSGGRGGSPVHREKDDVVIDENERHGNIKEKSPDRVSYSDVVKRSSKVTRESWENLVDDDVPPDGLPNSPQQPGSPSSQDSWLPNNSRSSSFNVQKSEQSGREERTSPLSEMVGYDLLLEKERMTPGNNDGRITPENENGEDHAMMVGNALQHGRMGAGDLLPDVGFSFYQMADGSQTYLHPFWNQPMLCSFHRYNRMPAMLSVPLDDLDEYAVTVEMRMELPFLKQFPLGMAMRFVDADLRNILDAGSKKRYGHEIRERRKLQAQEKRRQKKQEQWVDTKAQKAQQDIMAPYQEAFRGVVNERLPTKEDFVPLPGHNKNESENEAARDAEEEEYQGPTLAEKIKAKQKKAEQEALRKRRLEEEERRRFPALPTTTAAKVGGLQPIVWGKKAAKAKSAPPTSHEPIPDGVLPTNLNQGINFSELLERSKAQAKDGKKKKPQKVHLFG